MPTPFLALTRKDVKLFFSNRRALLMTVAAPIAIASFFGYLFGGGSAAEPSRIPVLAVDQDGSTVAREITAALTADKNLAVKAATLEGAREAVRKGKATVAFVIPKGFGADAGRAFFNGAAAKPEIGVLYDPSHAAEMGMVEGILTGHVMEAVSKEMFNGPAGRAMARDTLAQLDTSTLPADQKTSLRELLHGLEGWNAARETDAAAGRPVPSAGLTVPFQVKSEAVTSGAGVKYNGYAHSFGGMGIQFILFMVMLGGAWVPTFLFPAWLQKLTVVVPTRWAMDGLDATTWRGLDFDAAALPIALLTGCALAFGALAVLRFRWDIDG